MPQVANKQDKSEIERVVDVDRMGPSGTALEITASESERAALAKRFGFLGLPAFSARVTVDRRPGDQVVVEGRLRGSHEMTDPRFGTYLIFNVPKGRTILQGNDSAGVMRYSQALYSNPSSINIDME